MHFINLQPTPSTCKQDDLFSDQWLKKRTLKSGIFLLDSILPGGYPELQKIHSQNGEGISGLVVM